MTYWECDNCHYLTRNEKDADTHVEETDHTMTWWHDDETTGSRGLQRLLTGQEP